MARITMRHVIDLAGLHLKEYRSGRWRGKCPFHKTNKTKEHNCFHVDQEKGYHCFSGSCNASGGPIKFIRDYFHLQSYWKAHEFLAKEFNIKTDRYLEWENKILQPYRDYLKSRRISEETARHFNLSAMLHKYRGRIKIPIYSEGQERGAAFRSIYPNFEPRYFFSKGFKRNQHLYNLDSISNDTKYLILVEGFFSVFSMYQLGWNNVISSMGAHVSQQQQEILKSKKLPVKIFFDGDDAGYKAGRKLEDQLKEVIQVERVQLQAGKQPDHLSRSKLEKYLGTDGR